MTIKAVIFDLGGVVLDSPLELFTRYEQTHGLPRQFIGRVVVAAGESGAWARLERGELLMPAFCEAFDEELVTAGARISSAALMLELAKATVVREQMLTAIRRIRAASLKLGAITNNWISADGQYERMDGLRKEFDVFIESCKVGMRKPDPRIYRIALEQLEIDPAEAVFLDDIGVNLKAARALGMITIKVADPSLALAELEAVLQIPLLA